MYCRYCGTEMKGKSDQCQACGKDNFIYREPRKKLTPKQWKAIIAAVLAVAILIPTIFFGVQGIQYLAKDNNIYFTGDYTIVADKVDKHMGKVVATVGEHKLTNGQLQIFYWMRVYEFLNNNSKYLTSLGLDYTKPLSEQYYNKTSGQTWQMYFMEDALNTWHRYIILNDAAKKADYKLPEASQKELDGLYDSAKAAAEKKKIDSVDAFLQTEMGPGATFENYFYYTQMHYIANMYFKEVAEAVEPTLTEAEIEAFFAENEDMFKNSYSITKESGDIVSVRHILIEVEQNGKDDDGKAAASEEDWAKCLKTAEKILDEFKTKGEQTGERFGELAKEHSKDPGSKDVGGLYEGIRSTTNFVEPFLNWCMDKTRKPGDTGLVKTTYGYHIMYFVEGEPGWIMYSRVGATDAKCQEQVNQWLKENPLEANYKKMAIGEFSLA